MISQKVVIILVTLAILLSITSIVVTISSMNSNMIPELNPKTTVIPDTGSANVGISVVNYNKPTNG